MRWIWNKLLWLRPSKRWLGRFVAATSSFLATLVTLWFAMNWYGEWEWKSALAEYESMPSVRELQAEPKCNVPTELRYGELPCIRSGLRDADLFMSVEGKARYFELTGQTTANVDSPVFHDAGGISTQGFAVDSITLRRWKNAFRSVRKFPIPGGENSAEEVLLALRHWQPELDDFELLAAERRKRGFTFDVEYVLVDYRKASAIRAICKLLSLRAEALFDLGRLDEAVADIRLLGDIRNSVLSFQDPIASDPPIQLAIIWKGITGHLWRAKDLVEIQSRLGHFEPRFWAIQRAFEFRREANEAGRWSNSMDMAGALDACGDIGRLLARHVEERFRMVIEGDFQSLFDTLSFDGLGLRWNEFSSEIGPPTGRLCRCLVPATQWRDDVIQLRVYRTLAGPLWRRWVANEISAHEMGKVYFSEYMERDSRASLGAEVPNLLEMSESRELQCRLAIVACAIERYRLEHLDLPPDLAVLTPYLAGVAPVKSTSGNPLFYRRLPTGEFILAGDSDSVTNNFRWLWPSAKYTWRTSYD